MKKYISFLLLVCGFFPLAAQENPTESLLKQEWKAFSVTHPSLKELSASEIAQIANEWGKKTAHILSTSDPVREIDPSVVENLVLLLQEQSPKIFMRHGEQQKTTNVQQLPIAQQKIAMMRLPDNLQNSLTPASLAEWIEGMIVWEYLKQKTGRSIVLESSKNRRAELLATSLAYVLKTKPLINDRLNCVNYPSQDLMSTAEILEWLPDGTLPWEKKQVDAVIGPGTYDHITQEMKTLLSAPQPPHAIFMAITHTQQTNAIATLADLPATRLGNFGFILITRNHKEVFSEGFYRKNNSQKVK